MNTQLHLETAKVWDEAASIYERDENIIISKLRVGDTSALSSQELPFFSDLSSWCKRAIHLQCSGGADLLTIWKMGAEEVVGIDISERMIHSALRKSKALEAPAHWHCCDVLNPPEELYNSADLVYTGKGAIPWIMDLTRWAEVVSRLLRPGGKFFIFEGHPLDWVWDSERAQFEFDLHDGHYFSEKTQNHRWPNPLINQLKTGKPVPKAHEHQWTLGQIMNSLIDAGLVLARFEEYPEPFWNHFPKIPKETLHRLPHSFSMVMCKPK